MDDMEYLQPSFDPSTLTMPRLRNILMSHDIQYPASAKKTQLVDIFIQELKPKARKLLAARERVRRTSEGITNMPSQQTTASDDDASSMPPPSVAATPRPRTSRKSARAPTEESIRESSPSNTGRATGRKSASRQIRQSDTETDGDPQPATARRKSRKSEATPKVKAEEPERLPVRPSMPESAFSDDNPFQSGSSPLAEEASRRKSAGTGNEKKRSSSGKIKTEANRSARTSTKRYTDEHVAVSSRTFEVPVSSLSDENSQEDEVEAGEEFTPEEQVELLNQRAANGGKDIVPVRAKKRSGRSKVPKSAPWVVLTSLLVGCATWYRQEKLAVGYCGVGRPSDSQLSIQLPEWADFLQPACEPCPQHAICYEGLETFCEADFVLLPHPLSLGGLIPIPPSCEPDGEKARKVKAVADRAVETLRQRNAEAECGTLKDNEGRDLPAEMPERELKKEVSQKRRRGMGEAEFEDLWKGAIGEIIGREEVVTSQDGRLLSSNSLARLPISCAIRRSARLALARHRQSLSILTALVMLVAYIRHRIQTNRADAARVPYLVSTTLDRLATQAALHARGDTAEGWISVGQLRDDILRDIFSDSRRESMWTRVRDIVEKNANVRASVREGRGGDVSRVWEWIGSLGILNEHPSEKRRSDGGKRVSFGRLDEDDSNEESQLKALAGGSSGEMVEKRKWDEGRPIY